RLRRRQVSVLGQWAGAWIGRNRRGRQDSPRQEARRAPGRPHRPGGRHARVPRAHGGARERVHGRGDRARDPRASHHVRSGGAGRARLARAGDRHVTATPSRDPLATGLGALATGVGLGGATITLAQGVVAELRTRLAPADYRPVGDPLLAGLLAGVMLAAFFGWRRSRAIENVWQRGVISV